MRSFPLSYYLQLKGEFAVVPTAKICELCHMTNVTYRSHNSEFWILKGVIFVDCRLMKNNIFNKTESFVGRNTSNHACQISCSKSNGETMIFHPRDNRGQNNEQSEYLSRPQLFIPTVPVYEFVNLICMYIITKWQKKIHLRFSFTLHLYDSGSVYKGFQRFSVSLILQNIWILPTSADNGLE